MSPDASPGSAIETLSVDDLAAWDRDGYLHVRGVFDDAAITTLRAWVDDLSGRRPGELGLLQHYELTAAGATLARTERLVEVHDGWRSLLTAGQVATMASQLLGEPVVLYKEKINHKLAGGAGFAPHQDAPAYPFVDAHLTGMVALDDADAANGCLEVVPARHDALLALDDDGCIHPDVVGTLSFRDVPVRAGDMLWFHSLVPHRSGPNATTTTRRALFCTYNAARLGDLRTAYYDHKIGYLAQRGNDPSRVSTIGDFQGVRPSDDDLRRIGVLP